MGHTHDTLAYQEDWDLFSAGVFEDDVNLVTQVRELSRPPRRICAVAAGVAEFGRVVNDPEGIFGIAQWCPGSGNHVEIGLPEGSFLEAYKRTTGSQPDYPAVQAVAGAVLAIQCAELAGSTGRRDLWNAAISLETSTLFGAFGIDPRNGSQVKHATVLVGWERGKLVRAMKAPTE